MTSTSETRAYARVIGDRLDGSPLCVMLDVDGTLAPIAPTPERATVPPETREVVARLVRAPATIVVLVSGRAAGDAWKVANVAGVWVIGNHGFEIRDPGGRVIADERVRGFDDAMARAAATLERELNAVPGAIVENKRWTLSVHYRMVPATQVHRLKARAEDVARALELRVLDGKKIVELRPPLDIDKGTACVAFLERHGVTRDRGSVLYIGDDRTDEDAFRELRAVLPDTVTIRVASAEDATEVTSEAELVLSSLQEVRELLSWVADRRTSVR
ncbi:MAG: trehalose-phosphatase [Gemmatimonadaceae bacterium]